MATRRQASPVTGSRPVATGWAELVPDRDGRQGWTMVINGVPSSHVDLDDPLRLEFEYVRWIARVVDLLDEPGAPLRAVHLGGAGCTLARYLAATRPGAPQTVFEIDPDVAALAREAFGGHRRWRTRIMDARAGLAALEPGRGDLVIRDAFGHESVPVHLTTRGFLAEVIRTLAPRGVYLANIAESGLRLARVEAATALAAFRHVMLLAEPGHLSGSRYGNVVLAASNQRLPVAGIARLLAGDAVRATVMDTAATRSFAAGATPLFD
jgi:spermidine synthase